MSIAAKASEESDTLKGYCEQILKNLDTLAKNLKERLDFLVYACREELITDACESVKEYQLKDTEEHLNEEGIDQPRSAD